jgi:hypothetical protein
MLTGLRACRRRVDFGPSECLSTGVIRLTDEQDVRACSPGVPCRDLQGAGPELLLVYPRLSLVCELLDLTKLVKIPVSLPGDVTRKQIVSKVRESLDARREAGHLLEEAKAMASSKYWAADTVPNAVHYQRLTIARGDDGLARLHYG